MQLSFVQVRRCRELVDVVGAITTARSEIAQIERGLARATGAPGGIGAPAAVGDVRASLAREELAAKRTEVEDLIRRAEALAGDIGSGDPADAATPRAGSTQPARAAGHLRATAPPIRLGPIQMLNAGLIGVGLAVSFVAGQVVGNPGHGVLHEPLSASVASAAPASAQFDVAVRAASAREMGASSNGSGIFVLREPATAAAVAPADDPGGAQTGTHWLDSTAEAEAGAASDLTSAAAPEIEEGGGPDLAERHPVSPSEVEPDAAPALGTGRLIAGAAGGVNMRQAPSLSAPIVQVIAAGARVGILDGRVRADGLAWQQVRSPNAKDGWVVAGTVAR